MAQADCKSTTARAQTKERVEINTMNQIFKDNTTNKLYTMLYESLSKKRQVVFSDLVHKRHDEKVTSEFEVFDYYFLDAKEVEEIYNEVKQ